MSAKVSVIVNFHNSEKYIEECLNSIINQTYENLEIVLWDNCSTDKTYKVIKKFKDQRIKYFKLQQHRGRTSALNLITPIFTCQRRSTQNFCQRRCPSRNWLS